MMEPGNGKNFESNISTGDAICNDQSHFKYKKFLMVFDQILSLTKGGPAQSTESISYLIYKNGMDGGQFGFQSANAVLFFVVIVAISIFQMTVMGKKEEQL